MYAIAHGSTSFPNFWFHSEPTFHQWATKIRVSMDSIVAQTLTETGAHFQSTCFQHCESWEHWPWESYLQVRGSPTIMMRQKGGKAWQENRCSLQVCDTPLLKVLHIDTWWDQQLCHQKEVSEPNVLQREHHKGAPIVRSWAIWCFGILSGSIHVS